jgi:hypothetical protein
MTKSFQDFLYENPIWVPSLSPLSTIAFYPAQAAVEVVAPNTFGATLGYCAK